ncbi:MAG: hypothetical protein ABIQ06_15040 [Caldimonas sp.]
MKLIAKALVLLSFDWFTPSAGAAGVAWPKWVCGSTSPPVAIPTLLLLCSALFQPAQAQQGSYTRINLPQRLSIEIPSDWKVLSQANRSNIAAAGSAMMESAGQKGSTGKKETLLAVQSPDPSGATVRLSVTTPPEYSQADLASATASDLKEMEDALLEQYRKLERSGGPKVIQMQAARLETIGGHRALVISYRRSSPAGPSPWQVVQYSIPLSDRLVQLTLSHRESDAAVSRPVLEKVKRSMQF